MPKQTRYSDRNKTQTGTSKNDRGFINQKSQWPASGQPGYGSTPDPVSSRSRNGLGRNPKQKDAGPMKSAPFPANKDHY